MGGKKEEGSCETVLQRYEKRRKDRKIKVSKKR